MNLCEILAINLKYYRKKYNLSQEKFAEVLDTTLSYLNQIENNKINVKSSLLIFLKNLLVAVNSNSSATTFLELSNIVLNFLFLSSRSVFILSSCSFL